MALGIKRDLSSPSSVPNSRDPIRGSHGRHRLTEELFRRYPDHGFATAMLRSTLFRRKMIAYRLVVSGAHVIKRMIDIAASGAGLIVAGPILALLALLIKLTDGGPALYWQTRVGLHGREFPFPKLRSMRTDSDRLQATLNQQNQHQAGVTFKMKHDPRITWIGRIIRKFSLDELPQLWCVLHGDMSLVGPRPPLPREVAQYSLSDRRRLDVIPGLTCIWQVSGRADIPFPQQVALDVEYIESRSLWLDIQLLLRTIPAVVLGRGAY